MSVLIFYDPKESSADTDTCEQVVSVRVKLRAFNSDTFNFSKFSFLSLNCPFWGKITKMITTDEVLDFHKLTLYKNFKSFHRISRLNSGIKNRKNFFQLAIFFIWKNRKWLSQSFWFWGYQNFGPILWEFDFENFWKCVGGVYMRGCFIPTITQ